MIARDPKAPVIAPPGGVRLGGKTFREGQRIPKKYQKIQPERSQDPASGINNAPPNFGRSILPSIYTFGTRISTVSHVYLNPDNAMRDNIQNARFMRNDCAVMECLEARQRGVALLNWHLEPEDKDDPKQKQLATDLTAILQRTPRFTEYRRNLLEAVWYGRYAVQHLYGWATVRGQRRRVISAWEPINGDKLAFRYDDGSGRHREGDLGIRIGLTYLRGDVFGGRKVESTGEYGMAYFLEDWERKFVAVHKHMIEDGWFEDPQSAGRKHGVGVRDRIYWCWLLKQETSAALMEVIERTGTGFTIYRYPHGNPAAKAEMEELGKNQTRTNVIVMPAMPGDPSMDAFAIERIEPSTAGIETMKSVIHEFFGHQIKRYILGQTLSTEAASTGLGSGVADLHQDTGLQVIAYDASNLEETITNETLDPLKELNFPWARDIRVLFKIDTKDSESDRKLAAFRQAWDMGAKLKSSDVMDVIGASMPTEDDETLYNPQIVGAIQQMEQGGGMQPGQPGAAGGQPPQDQNAHDFGPLMQLIQGGGGEGDYATGGQSPSGGDGPPPPSESGPSQYAKHRDSPGQKHLTFDPDAHPRAPKGSEHGGEFVKADKETDNYVHPFMNKLRVTDAGMKLVKDAKKTANEFRKRNGQGKTDYELTELPLDDVKPVQFGEDYDNASSRYLAEYIGKFRSSGRIEDYAPIIVDKDNVIVDGHHRHFAHKHAGLKTIPAIRPIAEPAAESAKEPATKTDKNGVTWAHAKKVEQNAMGKWGETSPVDGIFRAAGQWMPIHGLSVGQKPAKKAEGKSPPPQPPDDEGSGKRQAPQEQRQPMTAEEIEERRRRQEREQIWSEVQSGPLGRTLGLGDRPHNIRWGHGIAKKWMEVAEQAGPEAMKNVAEYAKNKTRELIGKEIDDTGDRHLDPKYWGGSGPVRTREQAVEHAMEAYEEGVNRAAGESSWGITKKHLKTNPHTAHARQWVATLISEVAGGQQPDVLKHVNDLMSGTSKGNPQ